MTGLLKFLPLSGDRKIDNKMEIDILEHDGADIVYSFVIKNHHILFFTVKCYESIVNIAMVHICDLFALLKVSVS